MIGSLTAAASELSPLTQLGAFGASIAIAYYLIRRSDDRETRDEEYWQSLLADEQRRHEETRRALYEALRNQQPREEQ